MRFIILFGLLCPVLPAFAQDDQSDSTRVLDEVVVKAYRSNRPLKDVPVTVNVLDTKTLNRYGSMSMVPTVNSVPGVRMEERSPGSYRFSVRGSVLRSPFGVRNVKFYYKGLPFTDGGGNTYLNLLDLSSVSNMEIIKGPGASLYGAGTGGVVLLDSPDPARQTSYFTYTGGSYGLLRLGLQSMVKYRRSNLDLGISSQRSDGYRQQTEMSRINIRANWDIFIKQKGKLTLSFLNGDLYYQTPGGLNAAQFEADPRQARPTVGANQGAVDKKASVNNETFYYAALYQHDWSEHWSSTIGANVISTTFKNAAILNYERRGEENFGGRTETQYTFGKEEQKGKITFGAEYQRFNQDVKNWDNNGGSPGAVQDFDKLTSTSFVAFAQVEFELPWQFLVTAGGSLNSLKYDMERYTTPPPVKQQRKFDDGFYPRLAVIKKFGNDFSVYSSFSNGFSAPTLAEIRPSTGNFNANMNPETGRSIEVGIRSELFDRQVRLNLAAYDFRLKETIVVQAEQNGEDYFINAGTTSQKGIESTVSWNPAWGTSELENFRLWVSYTYNHYYFLDYINNQNDFSGNRITGIPPTVLVTGVDVALKKGWYANVMFNYTDHIPLNDGNSEFAKEYKVLSARIGKRQNVWRFKNVDFFLGVDNALNEVYSLGNDLNAAFGRYYNVAPARNFYGGVTVPLVTARRKTE